MFIDRSEYPLCRHIKTNGRRCQSPAVTASAFCYHHRKLRRTRRSAVGSTPVLSPNILHPLHDAADIRHMLARVLSGIATCQLHPKQAGQMTYALQTAALNLRQPTQNQDLSHKHREIS